MTLAEFKALPDSVLPAAAAAGAGRARQGDWERRARARAAGERPGWRLGARVPASRRRGCRQCALLVHPGGANDAERPAGHRVGDDRDRAAHAISQDPLRIFVGVSLRAIRAAAGRDEVHGATGGKAPHRSVAFTELIARKLTPTSIHRSQAHSYLNPSLASSLLPQSIARTSYPPSTIHHRTCRWRRSGRRSRPSCWGDKPGCSWFPVGVSLRAISSAAGRDDVARPAVELIALMIARIARKLTPTSRSLASELYPQSTIHHLQSTP
jgi:hypothetical protein